MAIRQIRTEDDPCLYKKCRTVDRFDERLSQLIDDMYETMYKSEGAGLAAPQVGILRRVAVVDAEERPLELVNPEIISRSGLVGAMEGCLSFPEQSGYVERSEKVTIQAQNRQGEPFTYEAEGFEARAIQHELDHLEGIVYLSIATDPPEGFEEEAEE